MQKGWIWIVLIIAVVAVGGIIFAKPFSPPISEEEDVFCTADAMLCPDGTYVGRTGPNCEFVCPDGTPSPQSQRIETRINQGASALGVTVIPLELLEESRCPIDVQCIQAGTVRVRAQVVSELSTSTNTFTLRASAITTEAEEIVLVEVLPLPRAGIQIPLSQYQFVFEIKKRNQAEINPSS